MKSSTDRKDMETVQTDQNFDKENLSENKGKKNGILLNIILVLCIVIFLGCGGYLGAYFYSNHKAETAFSAIKETVEAGDCIDEKGKPVYVTVQKKQVYKKYASV